MEKKLERLLSSKKFSELLAEEKYYVTEFVSESEYERMHLLLKKGKPFSAGSPPIKPEFKNKLLAAYRIQHEISPEKKPNKIIHILNHRLPAWQVAAAIALLFGVHFWLQSEPTVLIETETIYVHNTDTIYKEVAIPSIESPTKEAAPKINQKPKKQQIKSSDEPVLFALADSSSNKYAHSELPDSFGLNVSYAKGVAASQTVDLWELFEEVY